MFKFIGIILLITYLTLMYFFRKNDILLLLMTLIMILIMCNLKNIEGQSPTPSPVSPSPVSPPDATVSPPDTTVSPPDETVSPSPASPSSASPSPSGPSVKGVKGFEDYHFEVADDYQMGPYDNLILEFKNPRSKHVRQLNVPLSSREELCVDQGNELPLKCKKTFFSGMGPSIDGDPDTDRNMFMFYRNKTSPDCCPSTFSTSNGCVCTTRQQRDFINNRGV